MGRAGCLRFVARLIPRTPLSWIPSRERESRDALTCRLNGSRRTATAQASDPWRRSTRWADRAPAGRTGRGQAGAGPSNHTPRSPAGPSQTPRPPTPPHSLNRREAEARQERRALRSRSRSGSLRRGRGVGTQQRRRSNAGQHCSIAVISPSQRRPASARPARGRSGRVRARASRRAGRSSAPGCRAMRQRPGVRVASPTCCKSPGLSRAPRRSPPVLTRR